MDNSVVVALISAGGSVLVAVTALILNYRGFASIDARMLALETRVDSRLQGLKSRLNLLQSDLKDLYRAMVAIEMDVAKLKDHAGM